MVDDPAQVALAREALSQSVFVSTGVLMETEWVLRSRYHLDRNQIVEALGAMLNVGTLIVADPDLVDWSLERYGAGADLADMLHVAASRNQDAFVTLDGDIISDAGPDAPVRIERLQ